MTTILTSTVVLLSLALSQGEVVRDPALSLAGQGRLTVVKAERQADGYDPSSSRGTEHDAATTGKGARPGLGVGDQEIRRMLERQGYAIVRYERERHSVEVHADRNGARWELKIDPMSGRLIELEREED